MTKVHNYDKYTISWKCVHRKNKQSIQDANLVHVLLSLKGEARTALRGMLDILDDDTIDHKEVIGVSKYRYMFKCTQNKLADLIKVDRGNFARGIKQLTELNLVYKEDGIIYINPLLPNQNKIVDIRTLDKFGITYDKSNTSSITRKKQDPNKIRTNMKF